MTWTKLGSEFLTDPVIQSVGRGPRHLLVEALIWCNQHGTDGKVPSHMLTRITDEPDPSVAAGHLVSAGLWLETEDGWTIVGFLDEQPSAADVERTAALTRDRQRRQRQHRNGDHSLCESKYCNAAKTTDRRDGVTRDTTRASAVSHDSRTVPIRAVKAKDRDGAVRGSANAAAPAPPKVKPKVKSSGPQTSGPRTYNFAPGGSS